MNSFADAELMSIGAYPQNFECKIGLIKSKDSDGVIQLDYKGNLGFQYNPNAIAQLALGYYDKILAGEDFRDEFLAQASFFLRHGRLVEGNILLWEYNFPFEMRNYLCSPWRSALAQGQGISVALRAYLLTGNEQYLEVSKNAFASFRYLAREHPGGVLDDEGGFTWLEEYIVDPPNHVLNGFIWALWGVRDYAIFFNDQYAWQLWAKCLATLKENLKYYDRGFWTTYDLVSISKGVKRPVMPCSIYYQRLHVVQMKAMYNLTNDHAFLGYAERWELQLASKLKCVVSQVWKAYFKLRWF